MTSPHDLDPWREPTRTSDADDDAWRTFVAGEPVTTSVRARQLALALGRSARDPLAVALALLLLGPAVGLVWAHLSPRVSITFSAQGPSLEQPESSQFFTADGSFLFTLVAAGLLTGAVMWWLARDRGPGLPVGFAVGAIAAGAVAREVAGRVVVDERLAALCRSGACDVYDGTQRVRTGVVEVVLFGSSRSVYLGGVVWAVAGLLAFGVLLALVRRDSDGETPWTPPESWSPPAA